MGGRDQSVARGRRKYVREEFLPRKIDRGRNTAEMISRHLCPDRPVELIASLTEQIQRLARFAAQAGGKPAAYVVDHPEHPDHRGGQDRRRPSLVVKADVAAGDRYAKGRAAIGQSAHGLRELPHHPGILRRTEVEAVGDRDRGGAGDGDVAVRLGQGQLSTGVRIELGVPTRGVGRHRNAAVGLFVDAQHTAVGVLGEHGVTAHVAVVLRRDERPTTQVRTTQ